MNTSKNLKVCENHLANLYDALKRGDLEIVEELEHELTPEEECVACAYSFKFGGEAGISLEHFLKQEGFEIEIPPNRSIISHFSYWGLRISIFIGIFALLLTVERLLKIIMFKSSINYAFSAFEFFGVAIIAVFLFTFVDNAILE